MRKVRTFLVPVVFATVLALSSVMCLSSSFGLEIELRSLILGSLALSCWYGLAMVAGKGWKTALICLAPGLLLVKESLRTGFLASFCGLGYDIFVQLGNFYSSAAIAAESLLPLASDQLLWALLALGALLSLHCLWATLGSGPVWPVFGWSLLLLSPCLMVVDMVPDLGPLLTFTGCLCLLVLTRSRFDREPRQGAGLALRLAIPLALLLILLAWAFPPEEYVRPQWPDDLRESLSWHLEKGLARLQGQELPEDLAPVVNSSLGSTLAELEDYDLAALGPRRTYGRKVMEVRTSGTGSVYLRGASFGQYGENRWSSADAASYPTSFSAPMTSGEPSGAKAVDIRTVVPQPLMYLPYYLTEMPQGGEAMRDVYVGNVDEIDEYTTYRSELPKDGYWNDAYERYVYKEYLQVPEELDSQLFEHLMQSGVLAVSSTDAMTQGIVSYVQALAVYDLDTPAVPEGEDFALWFLDSSHRGYCVHFATACCLLMRKAGIPARYVTGYLAQADSGQWSNVTDSQAHAWVEYYVSGFGWMPVECTPAAALEEQLLTDQLQQTEQPVESTPEPVTVEPVPEESAQPSAQPESTPEPSTEISPEPQSVPSREKSKGSPLLWLLLIPAAVIALALRRWLALRVWDKRYLKASPNTKARLIWRRIDAALRILKEEPPADQEDLVLKARFSQHQLTDQELDQLEQLWAGLRFRLAKRGVAYDLVYKYVLVLY